MESDMYKVELLHYLNPHLIWVLVADEGEEKNVRFEQIGIYGVTPLSITFDYYDGKVSTNQCADWLPAVFLAMKNIFLDASEIWFSVTFLDRTTSIFDNNVHKYGELTIKMNDGKTVSMIKHLLETGFVAEDSQLFHQTLKNTKLDYVNTVGVVNKIRQALKQFDTASKDVDTLFKKQISVFLKTKEIEETVCERYLNLGVRHNNTQLLLQKQINDLNACKDVDEESAGRACRKSSRLLKTLRMMNSSQDIVPEKLENENFSASSSSVEVRKPAEDTNKNIDMKREDNDENYGEMDVIAVKKVHKKKGKNVKNNKPDTNKRLIAFGPPGINPTQYRVKEFEIAQDTSFAKDTDQKRDVEQDQYVLNRANSVEHEVDELNMLKGVNEKCKAINAMSCSFSSTKREEHRVEDQTATDKPTSTSRKMAILKQKLAIMNEMSSSTSSAFTQGDDSDSESISALVAKLDLSNGSIRKEVKEPEIVFSQVDNNVNPFKNLDGSA